jgi:release factor glutamine methyltransferase
VDIAAVVDRLRAAGCVFAEDEARLLVDEASTPRHLAAMVAERASGVPIEHVVGWAEFRGRRVEVSRGVFVPRRRTELLVREAYALVRPGAVVVDVCCGSGAVGAALLAEAGEVAVHAIDIDPVAVRCARRNLPTATVYLGDLFEPLPERLRGRVDVVVANAPYVPSDALGLMPPEARDHEPVGALDGGPDGLAVVGRIVDAAPIWLAPAGYLLVETSQRQSARLVEMFTASGLRPRVAVDETLGATVVIGRYGDATGSKGFAARVSWEPIDS